MIRQMLAAVLVIGLWPSVAAAQTPVITITATSADVHISPSVGSRIVGRAMRGRVLELTRIAGDWVKVLWPDAPEGAGYVRIGLGTLSVIDPAANGGAAATAPAPALRQSAATPALDVRGEIAAVDRSIRSGEQAPAAPAEYVLPPAHTIGIGGLINGSTVGYGGSARIWSARRIGLQLELSRYALTPVSTIGRVNGIQFAPSAIYTLKNHVSDSMWLRPYIGGGVRLSRLSLRLDPTAEALTENRRSWQIFGGTELTLPGAPRFAMSADVRYDSSNTPFAGFEFGGLGFSVSGHWYVK